MKKAQLDLDVMEWKNEERMHDGGYFLDVMICVEVDEHCFVPLLVIPKEEWPIRF